MSSASGVPDAISEAICQVAFDSEDPVELSLVPGDRVYVTCKDVGGGWWEGICSGILGLFPQNYVREIQAQSATDIPPESAPKTDCDSTALVPKPTSNAIGATTTAPIPIKSTNPFAPAMAVAQVSAPPSALSAGTGHSSSVSVGPSHTGTGSAPATHCVRVDGISGEPLFKYIAATQPNNKVTMRGQPRGPCLDTIPLSSSPPPKTVFDDFKGNGETERHVTTILPGAMWQRVEEVYAVAIVKSDDKGHKYHGIKTYTVFDITDTRSNVVVQRRFKHFDWLYEQFVRTYPCIIIPPLPEKQMKGRFDAEFIERRRRRLQLFLNRVARHPVLGVSPVFKHFVSAVLHKEWKAGKRKSEQQKEFLRSVQLAPQAAAGGLRPGAADGAAGYDADAIMESTTAFMSWLGKQIASWHVTGEEVNATMDTLASSYDRMADVLMKFAGAGSDRPPYTEWWDDSSAGSVDMVESGDASSIDSATPQGSSAVLPLASTGTGSMSVVLSSLSRFGNGVERIAEMIRQHHKVQGLDLVDVLNEYSGLVKSFKGVAVQYKTRKQLADSGGKQHSAEQDQLFEKASQTALAELRYFHEAIVKDFRSIVTEFIHQQIAFHQKAARTWEALLPDFDV